MYENLCTGINMTPFMAFDTSYISHLNTKWLISNFLISFAITKIRIVLMRLISIIYKYLILYKKYKS